MKDPALRRSVEGPVESMVRQRRGTTLATMLVVVGVAVLLLAGAAWSLLRWGMRWGATQAERAAPMPADAWCDARPRTAMTRAVSIDAAPETVWPWLAQLGRGAGWYSIDWLDNGRKTSAHHLVTWIPEPRRGDASPIGYLRHVEPGRSIAWWASGVRFMGAPTRLAVDMSLKPRGDGSRLVIRMTADATGLMARVALFTFQVMDSIMARSQLLGIQRRVERYGTRTENPDEPESGARDQYQHYEVVYANGERAGTPGVEQAARWHQAAIDDGVLEAEDA
jgi:hypothetical protein